MDYACKRFQEKFCVRGTLSENLRMAAHEPVNEQYVLAAYIASKLGLPEEVLFISQMTAILNEDWPVGPVGSNVVLLSLFAGGDSPLLQLLADPNFVCRRDLFAALLIEALRGLPNTSDFVGPVRDVYRAPIKWLQTWATGTATGILQAAEKAYDDNRAFDATPAHTFAILGHTLHRLLG